MHVCSLFGAMLKLAGQRGWCPVSVASSGAAKFKGSLDVTLPRKFVFRAEEVAKLGCKDGRLLHDAGHVSQRPRRGPVQPEQRCAARGEGGGQAGSMREEGDRRGKRRAREGREREVGVSSF